MYKIENSDPGISCEILGGERVNLYLKIVISIIFLLVVIFYLTSDSSNSRMEEAEYDTLNAGSTGIQKPLVENTTFPSEGQFNSSKNESSGPVAITLEKPPFIN